MRATAISVIVGLFVFSLMMLMLGYGNELKPAPMLDVTCYYGNDQVRHTNATNAVVMIGKDYGLLTVRHRGGWTDSADGTPMCTIEPVIL